MSAGLFLTAAGGVLFLSGLIWLIVLLAGGESQKRRLEWKMKEKY